ncbi:hypothetical protein GDO81_012079 [Engystomops pustulosus]|uniref:Uncharacterized protein n=1 Tax=Engystomops pustulosus TaxID=76066 RepID=A0AAV7BJ51_ENGPU|nr:hypothetical protein GDO81_012079 [Engystomops pustulosus]
MTNFSGLNAGWEEALLIGLSTNGLLASASNGLIMHYTGIRNTLSCSAYCHYWKHLGASFIKATSRTTHLFIILSLHISI